jgi:hypothetical protein
MEGATFPNEGRAANSSNAPSRLHTPALPTLSETQVFQNPHQREVGYRSSDQQEEQRPQRNIPVVATTYPSYESAEQEKSRLYNQAKAQADAQSNRNSYVPSDLTPSTSHNSSALDQSPSTAHSTGLSEKEQMKRYYEAQDAVRLSQQRAQAGNTAGSSSAVPRSTNRLSGANTAQTSNTTATGLTEKEQLAKYYAAQEEVQKHQAMQTTGEGAHNPSSSLAGAAAPPGNNALTEKQQLARYHAAQEEVRQHQMNAQSSSSQSSTVPLSSAAPPSGITAMTEKEQMRKYLEARDREMQGGANGETSAAPTMVSPRPVYAPNFHAMPTTPTPTTDTDNRTFAATTPLPQGQFPSILQTTGAVDNATKPRVVSFTPQSTYSQRQQDQRQSAGLPVQTQQRTPYTAPASNPTSIAQTHGLEIPTLQNLSLNYRGGTPNPLDGPWAPKIATPAWYDDQNAQPSTAGTSVPPPIPPKTALRP